MRVIIAVGAVAVGLTCFATPAMPQADDPTRDRPCTAWFEPTYDRLNVIFPDKATRYFGANFVIPPGGHVEVAGEFPHARYFSLQTATNSTRTIMSLPDSDILPDPGSLNPFLPGARRDAANRRFTVRIVNGRMPAPENRAPNTLYDSSAEGQPGNILAYRLYLADRGVGTFGGVPLPKLTLVGADGTRVPVPDCPDLVPDTSAASDGLGAQTAPPLPKGARQGYDPPVWRKLVSVPTNAFGDVTDQLGPPGAVENPGQTLPLDAFGASADNAYLYAYISPEHGRVLLIRARMPTTPKTADGQPVMGTGQMRYWSMCTADRSGTPTYDCKHDEQVPIGRDREFLIAVSARAQRPNSARTECGIAWMAWGPSPKTLVAIRNQLPAGDFAESVQRAEYRNEEKSMGAFFPEAKYFATAEDFDRSVGCRPPETARPPKRCATRRSVTVKVPKRLRRRARSVTVVVGGRKVARNRNPRKPIRIPVKGRGKRSVRVTLRVRTRSGQIVVRHRAYRLCRSRR